MADKYFDDFVNKQLELANTSPSIDWTALRDDWLKHLDEFYDSVRARRRYIIKIRVKCTPKQISEEHIGSYEAQSLEVQIGPARIGFDPVGTNLIGARGRVDMHGPYGSVKFVFAETEPPDLEYPSKMRPLRSSSTDAWICLVKNGRGKSRHRLQAYDTSSLKRNHSFRRLWKSLVPRRFTRIGFSGKHLELVDIDRYYRGQVGIHHHVSERRIAQGVLGG